MKDKNTVALELVKSFRKLAPLVYGRYWKTDLSRHLSVSSRQVLYWIKGEHVPPSAVVKFLALCLKFNYFYDRETGEIKRKRRAKSS
jgi:hypothetical protein